DCGPTGGTAGIAGQTQGRRPTNTPTRKGGNREANHGGNPQPPACPGRPRTTANRTREIPPPASGPQHGDETSTNEESCELRTKYWLIEPLTLGAVRKIMAGR